MKPVTEALIHTAHDQAICTNWLGCHILGTVSSDLCRRCRQFPESIELQWFIGVYVEIVVSPIQIIDGCIKLSQFWRIPIISYCKINIFTDKKIFARCPDLLCNRVYRNIRKFSSTNSYPIIPPFGDLASDGSPPSLCYGEFCTIDCRIVENSLPIL